MLDMLISIDEKATTTTTTTTTGDGRQHQFFDGQVRVINHSSLSLFRFHTPQNVCSTQPKLYTFEVTYAIRLGWTVVDDNAMKNMEVRSSLVAKDVIVSRLSRIEVVRYWLSPSGWA